MARRGEGRWLHAIAAELDLSSKRLHLWVAGQRRRFRPVAVHAAIPSPAGPSLRLVTSGGHRVEGLTREDLVAILRALS
jgi:hypothetical protein